MKRILSVVFGLGVIGIVAIELSGGVLVGSERSTVMVMTPERPEPFGHEQIVCRYWNLVGGLKKKTRMTPGIGREIFFPVNGGGTKKMDEEAALYAECPLTWSKG